MFTFSEEILNGELHLLCSELNLWFCHLRLNIERKKNKWKLTCSFKSSHRMCSVKKDVRRISQNSQENTCDRVSCRFIKKQTLAQVLSCEFCEISKNTFSTEHLPATASGFNSLFLFCYRRINRKYIRSPVIYQYRLQNGRGQSCYSRAESSLSWWGDKRNWTRN